MVEWQWLGSLLVCCFQHPRHLRQPTLIQRSMEYSSAANHLWTRVNTFAERNCNDTGKCVCFLCTICMKRTQLEACPYKLHVLKQFYRFWWNLLLEFHIKSNLANLILCVLVNYNSYSWCRIIFQKFIVVPMAKNLKIQYIIDKSPVRGPVDPNAFNPYLLHSLS